MSNKTPFEIRLDLLSLAQSILDQKNFAERDRLTNDWNARLEESLRDKRARPNAPTFPVSEGSDIIALAKELNEFVSNG